jgi:hypothetical protein
MPGASWVPGTGSGAGLTRSKIEDEQETAVTIQCGLTGEREPVARHDGQKLEDGFQMPGGELLQMQPATLPERAILSTA